MPNLLTYIKESHRITGFIREELLCGDHLTEFYPDVAAGRQKVGFDKEGYKLDVCTVFREDATCTHCGLAPEFRGVSK